MPQNIESMKFVIGDNDIIRNMENVPAFQPFDDSGIECLDRVSHILLNDTHAKQYPDVVTFAFWCRKASIRNLQKPYLEMKNRVGRGVVFHIAPSNVAVNFAYSLVVGILSGNSNIVRLPSKEFEQVRIICSAIEQALDDNMKKQICLVQYGHNQAVTDFLSSVCDTRIIWGGDQTISNIRKSTIKPRTTEITFADRYSIAIINADEYLNEKNKKSVAQGFYNDTYLSDQNACTSPRLIAWMGENIADAKNVFWDELSKIVSERYLLQPVQAVSKFANICRQAITDQHIRYIKGKENSIMRVKVDDITYSLMDYKGDSGYFMEYDAATLDELLPLFTSQCQTISYYGLDLNQLQKFVFGKRPKGIDRIVPIGRTMDFSLVWDGYDLIRSLSREITVY